TGRHPGAGRQRHHALLHDGGGAGRAQRLPREAQAPVREVPEAAVSEAALARPGAAVWLMAARPRTLAGSISPGVAGAAAAGAARPLAAALCLLSALFIQIGTNLANDYSDFKRGADAERVGPRRVTQSGLVAPAQVKRAAWLAFGGAGLVGVALAAI